MQIEDIKIDATNDIVGGSRLRTNPTVSPSEARRVLGQGPAAGTNPPRESAHYRESDLCHRRAIIQGIEPNC